MLDFTVTILFYGAAFLSFAVLIDGFIAGKARYAELHRILSRRAAPRIITVRMSCHQTTGRSQIESKTKQRPNRAAKISHAALARSYVRQRFDAAA